MTAFRRATLTAAALAWLFAAIPPGAEAQSDKPRFENLGTLAAGITDAVPVVFLGRLYRVESVPAGAAGNEGRERILRMVDVEAGTTGRAFATGHELGCAFATEEKLYVFTLARRGTEEITAFWTTDGENWSSKGVFRLAGWEIHGCSVCYEKDRYLMAFEVAEPEAVSATPMTIRFAESKDLVKWHLLGASHNPASARYPLGPTLIFDDIYYYLFFTRQRRSGVTETWIARSTDLLNWTEARKNPVLTPSDADRRTREGAAEAKGVKDAPNTMNVNLDLCSHRGRVVMYYSWGSPGGGVYLAEAVWRGYLRDWLVAFFRMPQEP